MDEHASVGERIAYYRRRGLTQEVLAGLVGRSAVWLSKIERGERTLDKVSLLFALARVLKVEPGDLLGGLRLPLDGGAPLDPPRGIPAVRHAVEGLVDLRDREAPAPAKLRADVDRARQLDASGSYETLGLELPELIIAARAAVEQDVPRAWESLAGAYQVASSLARTVGEVDLAWIAANGAVTASQQSGDQQLLGLSRQRLANVLMRQGWLDDAASVVSDAADALAPSDATPSEGWSVWGLLQLVGAVSAVRAGNPSEAQRALRDARSAAERVDPGRNDYWEAFGPASVGVMEVAVELEAGDAVEGLRLADGIDAEELPIAERRARFSSTWPTPTCCAVTTAQRPRRS
jgi:transcriptional regulator with XRE-family HTH domain